MIGEVDVSVDLSAVSSNVQILRTTAAESSVILEQQTGERSASLTLPSVSSIDSKVEYTLSVGLEGFLDFLNGEEPVYLGSKSSNININDVSSVDSIVSTTTTETLDVKVLRL